MFEGILIGLAALCAVYFVVIVLYAGIGTSFAFIWLFFSALLLLLVYGRWYYEKNRSQIPPWVPVSIVTTCLLGLVSLVVTCALVFLGAAASDHPGLDYVIVLGARGKEHTVSDTLKKRLDKAIEYTEKNPDTILVLSGGKGPGEQESEASVMYRYLAYNGVNPEKMLLEERSVSTVENIAYSKVLIDRHIELERQMRPPLMPQKVPGRYLVAADRPAEIGILTSNYHIFRARLTAEKWGLENVYGISADSDPVLFVHLCVREWASIIKDRLMGNM